ASGRRTTLSSTLNIALLPPTPTAMASTAAALNAGVRSSVRSAYLRSCRTESMWGACERDPCQSGASEDACATRRERDRMSRKWDSMSEPGGTIEGVWPIPTAPPVGAPARGARGSLTEPMEVPDEDRRHRRRLPA